MSEWDDWSKTALFLEDAHETLDPVLFDLTQEQPMLRENVRRVLVDWPLKALGLTEVPSWMHLVLHGSGISYNWDYDGDLDANIWVDVTDPKAMSMDEIKEKIGPVNNLPLDQMGVDSPEAMQYFMKDGTGTDLEVLGEQPYAAYDLDGDRWLKFPDRFDPEFYAKWFNSLQDRAESMARDINSWTSSYDIAVSDWMYWDAMVKRDPDFGVYQQARVRARIRGEKAMASLMRYRNTLFKERQRAYSPGGHGLEDRRDQVQKLLEVWGVLQSLKEHFIAVPPWRETEEKTAHLTDLETEEGERCHLHHHIELSDEYKEAAPKYTIGTLHPDDQPIVRDTLAKCAERFPGGMNQIKSVGAAKWTTRWASMNGDGRMRFNNHPQLRGSGIAKGDYDIEHTAAHEYAHAVFNDMSGFKPDVYGRHVRSLKELRRDGTFQHSYDEQDTIHHRSQVHAENRRIVNDMYNRVANDGAVLSQGNVWDAMKKEMPRHLNKDERWMANKEEILADALANHMLGHKGPMADAIGFAVDQHYKNPEQSAADREQQDKEKAQRIVERLSPVQAMLRVASLACGCCGTRLTPLDRDDEMCDTCQDSAEMENEHSDYGDHDHEPHCPTCRDVSCMHVLKKQEPKREPWEMTKAEYSKSVGAGESEQPWDDPAVWRSQTRAFFPHAFAEPNEVTHHRQDMGDGAGKYDVFIHHDEQGKMRGILTVAPDGGRMVLVDPAHRGKGSYRAMRDAAEAKGLYNETEQEYTHAGAGASHKYHVLKAIEEGKPVPPHVRAEYEGKPKTATLTRGLPVEQVQRNEYPARGDQASQYKNHSGVFGKGAVGYRGFGSWNELHEAMQSGEWKSQGMFNTRDEGDTQFSSSLDDVQRGAGLHQLRGTGFLGVVEADLSGLPWEGSMGHSGTGDEQREKAEAEERYAPALHLQGDKGTIHPTLGLGVGVKGGIPINRVKLVHELDDDGNVHHSWPLDEIDEHRDHLKDNPEWAPELKHRPETQRRWMIADDIKKPRGIMHVLDHDQQTTLCGQGRYSVNPDGGTFGETFQRLPIGRAHEVARSMRKFMCANCMHHATDEATAMARVGAKTAMGVGWTPQGESFHYFGLAFDVKKAHEIAQNKERFNVGVGAFAHSYAFDLIDKPNDEAMSMIDIDKEHAMSPEIDEDKPVLFASVPVGPDEDSKVLIDGNHRMFRAWKKGKDSVPAVLLDPHETASIIHPHARSIWDAAFAPHLRGRKTSATKPQKDQEKAATSLSATLRAFAEEGADSHTRTMQGAWDVGHETNQAFVDAAVEAGHPDVSLLELHGAPEEGFPNAHPRWQKIPPEDWTHHVVRVDGRLVDWAARQFDPKAPWPKVQKEDDHGWARARPVQRASSPLEEGKKASAEACPECGSSNIGDDKYGNRRRCQDCGNAWAPVEEHHVSWDDAYRHLQPSMRPLVHEAAERCTMSLQWTDQITPGHAIAKAGPCPKCHRHLNFQGVTYDDRGPRAKMPPHSTTEPADARKTRACPRCGGAGCVNCDSGRQTRYDPPLDDIPGEKTGEPRQWGPKDPEVLRKDWRQRFEQAHQDHPDDYHPVGCAICGTSKMAANSP